MRPLSAGELLATWERGLTGSPVERALLLLAAACPPATPDELARLPVGQRDRRLLELREWTFGPRLESQASCPRCSERLEMSLTVGDITVEAGGPSADVDDSAAPLSLTSGDYEVELRLPDSRDLSLIAERREPLAASRRRLALSCVVSARRRGRKVARSRLPQHVVLALAERMAAADPQATLELAPSCPTCEHRWQAPFDIATFFWAELDAWARRLLRDVHVLARAYGWSEGEILSLTPLRRQCYLEMVPA